jgi:hypothetical protein
MFKRTKNYETENPELGGIAQASDELSAALREFDERAQSWARIPEVHQVVRS